MKIQDVKTRIIKQGDGDTLYLSIPKSFAQALGLKEGDYHLSGFDRKSVIPLKNSSTALLLDK